jgi:hypothetical protein
VERTDWVRADFRNDLFIPECFDAEGTRTIVPVSFDVARLRAEGKLTPEQLKEEISRRFRDGTYRSPARPGISYMLSPVQRLYGGPSSKAVRLVNMPHYMFYAPNLTSKELGGGPVMGLANQQGRAQPFRGCVCVSLLLLCKKGRDECTRTLSHLLVSLVRPIIFQSL